MSVVVRGLAMSACAAAVLVGARQAEAADLGGDCCADLEQRIAELEATAARRGNRHVSLQVYGQVSEAVMWWNDGAQKGAYVVNNYANKNILGFEGAARIDSDWSAGFKLDTQIRAYRSNFTNQEALGDSNGITPTTYATQTFTIRNAHWYIQSKTWGRISIGRDADPVLGIVSINLGNPDGFAGSGANAGYASGNFLLRRRGTLGIGGLSALSWQTFAWIRNGDSPTPLDYAQTASAVQYTSPFFLGGTADTGFNVQAFISPTEVWSTALRYVENLGAVRVAAGAGYSSWSSVTRGACANTTAPGQPATTGGSTPFTDVRCEGYQLGASMMHTATGLYVSGGGGWLHDDNRQLALDLASSTSSSNRNVFGRSGVDAVDGMWWVQGGWQARLSPLGATTFWGEIARYNTGTGVNNGAVQTIAATDVINSLGRTAFLAGTQTRVWGLGVTQAIDAAAMNVYLGYLNLSTEGRLVDQSTARNTAVRSNPIDPMAIVYTGATIRF